MGLVLAVLFGVFLGHLPTRKRLQVIRRSHVGKRQTSARHVAIIMDGNRRYGRARYQDALKGHWDGGQTLVDTVRWCMESGVEILTVYAFSTENWKREEKEIDVLMTIFCKYAERCEQEAMEKNIRIRVFCTDKSRLPKGVIAAVDKMEHNTRENSGFSLHLCVSYGSRSDIASATRTIAEKVASGKLKPENIDEQTVSNHLVTRDVPDPDVLIRTSGEYRLSNYLLYELAYAELFFLPKFWPELTKADLVEVLDKFDARNRRFGV